MLYKDRVERGFDMESRDDDSTMDLDDIVIDGMSSDGRDTEVVDVKIINTETDNTKNEQPTPVTTLRKSSRTIRALRRYS